MANLRTQLVLQNIRFVDDEPDGGYEVVTAVFMGITPETPQPEDVPLVTKWDLVGNMLEKDLWTHPKVKAIFDTMLDPPNTPDGVPTDTYALLKRDIDDIVSGEKLVSELSVTPTDFTHFDNLKKFIRSLLRGVTSYPVSQYVLRNTLIIAENYDQAPPINNVMKIHTSAEVVTRYGVPSTIKFQMPEGYWLEQTPTVENTGAGEYTITREWWHADDFDNFIHERAA